jgi:hypothetical protein
MNGDPVDVGVEVAGTAVVEDLAIHDPAVSKSISGVRVIDVGQGDCIGLLDQDDEIFCYVDYGGFNYHPDAGISTPDPSAQRMPATLNGSPVAVVLTHWDKDHCWSAEKKNTQARQCAWIVPRQYVAPSVAVLASKLTNAKRWPESLGDQPVELPVGDKHRVTIRKCAPFLKDDYKADRNLTGLAVTIVREKNSGDEEIMLLPGDCPFDLIPNWESSLPIAALVAYHHGSHTHWTPNATDIAIQHWQPHSSLAYSVGFNASGTNSYGHPDTTSYGVNWNTNASTTAAARANGKPGIVMRWS